MPLFVFVICSLQGRGHLLELFYARVATPEDLGGPDHNSVFLGVVGGVVAWNLENGRNGRLVLDDHIPDSLGRALRDQHDADVGPCQEAAQSRIDLLISRVALDNHEVFVATLVAFAHAREQQTSDRGRVADSGDQERTFASLTLSHFYSINYC